MSKDNKVIVYFAKIQEISEKYPDSYSLVMRGHIDTVHKMAEAGMYEKAAEVIARSGPTQTKLDHAFHFTNNIDRSWTENDSVKCFTERPRSCSVGDVMEHDGKFFAVGSVGFRELQRFRFPDQEEKIAQSKPGRDSSRFSHDDGFQP